MSVYLYLWKQNNRGMKNVVTIRLDEDYVGMLENIKLELADRGLEFKDSVLMKTILLTGIRDINLKIAHGINIFDTGKKPGEE